MSGDTPHWSTKVRPVAVMPRDLCPKCERPTVLMGLGHQMCGHCESTAGVRCSTDGVSPSRYVVLDNDKEGRQ